MKNKCTFTTIKINLKHIKDPLIFEGKNKKDKYFEGW